MNLAVFLCDSLAKETHDAVTYSLFLAAYLSAEGIEAFPGHLVVSIIRPNGWTTQRWRTALSRALSRARGAFRAAQAKMV